MKNFNLILLLIVLLATPATAVPIEDTFYADIDAQGVVTGGSGHNDGEWYYYENTTWWNQWFYDDPLDLTRQKNIDLDIMVTSTDVDNWVEIAIDWSSDLYPSNPDSPPLPPLTLQEENNWIIRQTIFDGSVDEMAFIIPNMIFIPNYRSP